MNRSFFIALGAAATLGPAALAASAPAPAGSAGGRNDVVFQGVRLWHFKGSALDGVGSAERLAYDRSAASGHAQAARVDLPGFRGDPRPVHLQAAAALGHLAARTVDASGGVTLQREDGTARTASAHYDGPSQLITGQQPVTLDTARFHVLGQGFTLNAASGQIDLQGPVEAQGEARP